MGQLNKLENGVSPCRMETRENEVGEGGNDGGSEGGIENANEENEGKTEKEREHAEQQEQKEQKDRANDQRLFECNICFDTASEPVVSHCGHLYW